MCDHSDSSKTWNYSLGLILLSAQTAMANGGRLTPPGGTCVDSTCRRSRLSPFCRLPNSSSIIIVRGNRRVPGNKCGSFTDHWHCALTEHNTCNIVLRQPSGHAHFETGPNNNGLCQIRSTEPDAPANGIIGSFQPRVLNLCRGSLPERSGISRLHKSRQGLHTRSGQRTVDKRFLCCWQISCMSTSYDTC
jgi:hypothetical protein